MLLLGRGEGFRLYQKDPFWLDLSRLEDIVFDLLCTLEGKESEIMV